MTVADNTSRNQYTATPSQALFAYTFEIVDKDDIVVLINGIPLSEGTDYTVTGVGSDTGGNIVLTSGTTGGNIVTIYRDMPYSRTQNYTNSGDFLASEVNSDFDRLWLAGEQTDRSFSQSIRKPITDSDSISMELPVASSRADRFLTFDSNGAVTTTAVSSATAPQNIYRQQMTGDGTTTAFTLNFDSGSVGGAIVIYIDGVYQEGDTYNASGTSLVFTEAPPTNASIEVMYFKVAVAADIDATGTIYSQQFTGNGSTTAYTLGIPPGSTGKALQIFINGVYQDQGSYTVSGATLTFSEAPPNTSQIDVIAFRIKEIGATDANLVTYTPAGTGAVPTTVQTKLRETVSVKDFGAVGDGVTDDASAIQLALDSGASAVFVPQGTYRCDSTLTIPKNVSVFGEGPQSIFDFSNATTLTDNECIRTAEGSYTALPALNTAIERGDTTITFASAPSVSPGDVIVIYNDTDGSWSDWRTYYRAGEQVRVMQVSGNTVTVDGVLHDDYAIADVDLYKATSFTQCRIANFKVIANKSIASNLIVGVTLKTAIDSVIENVIVDQASYTGISIKRCFNVSILNCLAKDEGDIDVAGDYGLAIGNSHIVQVIGGEFVSARHGVTIGGGSGIGRVPNRFINISSAYIATIGLSIQAADIHGNAEYVSYDNCDIIGGITPGGDHTAIQNCRIMYGVNNGKTPVYYAELKGFTHRFTNNLVINKAVNDSSRGYFIDAGGNTDIVSDMTRGGVFRISGNDFRAENDSITVSQGIYIYDTATAGTTEPRDIYITNNTLHKADWVNSTRLILQRQMQIRRGSSVTSKFRRIVIDGNVGNGGIFIDNDNTSGVLADILLVKNNYFKEGDTPIISLVGRVIVNNNTFENMAYYGLNIFGASSNKIPYAFVENNRFVNCGWRHTSSSSQNANLIVWRCENVIIQNNHGFSNFETLRVIAADDSDGFTVGETITGGTSGVTATVMATKDPFIFVRDTASGAFTASETITGSSSGHTATLEASPNQQKFKYYYHLSMLQNDNLWHDHNVSQHSLNNYSSGNTNVVTTI